MASSNSTLVSGLATLAGLGATFWYAKKTFAPRSKKEGEKPTSFAIGKEFHDLFPKLTDYLVDHVSEKYRFNETHKKRVRWLLEYNVLGGKLYRGGLTMSIVQQLCQYKGLDYDAYSEKAAVLGWCIEILQACFLVADDVMDKSTTRRGQPCWYKQPSIQFDAVNDSLILESFIFVLLKKYFGNDTEMYLKLLELYHQVLLTTEMGQMLDLVSQPQGAIGSEVLKNFTPQTYMNIIHFKTSEYTFYLSSAVAMTLCGYTEKADFDVVYDICLKLGEKFQIQDDYLDAFADPKVLGKIGTDIQDHKCSWLCIQALKLMNPTQRALFEKHYGHEDEAGVQAIKDLFRELQLPELYKKNQQEKFEEISTLIAAANARLPADAMFLPILNKLHGRDK